MIFKNFIIAAIFVCGISYSTYAQVSTSFKELKLYPINNLDWKIDNNKSVEPFRKILSTYNILTLAESTHSDGQVYDASCMIMKELIDSGIVNTIYTESSCLNIEKINSILSREGKKGISEAQKYINSIELSYWLNHDFWDYLANKIKEKKVELVGFDIETTSPILMKEMLDTAIKLDTIINFIKKYPERYDRLKKEYDNINVWGLITAYSDVEYQEQISFINMVLKGYGERNQIDAIRQWEIILYYINWKKNRSDATHERDYYKMMKDDKELIRFFSYRDSIMANIFLKHYLNKPNAKAIALMSAYHAQRNHNLINGFGALDSDVNTYFLGEILEKKIPGQVYNICFVSPYGERGVDFLGRKDVAKIAKPVKNSFEGFFKRSEYPFFFTDIGSSGLRNEAFPMNVLFQKYLEAPWGKLFSGVFFTKEMYPYNYIRKPLSY